MALLRIHKLAASLTLLVFVSTTTTTAVTAQEDMATTTTVETATTRSIYLPGASGSGPFEALKDWIAAFEAKYPEADLSVSSVGSGAAQAALWGDVDCDKKPVEGICTSDSNPTSDNITATLWGMGGGTFGAENYVDHEELGLQQLPALGGPIMVTYSKDVTGDLGSKTSQQLNMSFATVAGIFNNSITRWNHPAIKADNPGLADTLPNDRITVVVRSDKSGMSQTLTEAIHHANPTTWPEEAVGKKPDWPLANLTHSTEIQTESVCAMEAMMKDDDNTTAFVPLNYKADGQTGIGISLLRKPSSVGYLELGYFSSLTRFVAQAHVSSPAHPQSFVPATVETLQTTMGGLADRLEPETLSLTLVDQDIPEGGYPISRYVYWYLKKDPGEYRSCYQAWLVYTFIEWTYTDPLAQEIALENGWVVPPQSVVDIALAKLQEMQCLDHEVAGSPVTWVADYVPPLYRDLESGNTSAQLVAVLVPCVLLALLVAGVAAGYIYLERKKAKADAVWKVQKHELDFKEQRMIGAGTFGMVMLAEYRGTQVAVKSVLPPEPKYRQHRVKNHSDPEQAVVHSKRASVRASVTDEDSHPGLSTGGSGVHNNSGIHHRSVSGTSKGRNSVYTSTKGGYYQLKRQHAQMRADFVTEMRSLAKLRHPNITTTMGAVLAQGEEPMLVMEYMHNGSLYDAIRNETINLSSSEDILTIVQDIAHGLRFLHSADPQVVHGDLKTKNVLIDANFRAKVADFGLSAKSHHAKLGARGTPYWMAPELLTGEIKCNNAASDVYAFGVLLYEVYARENPYEGEDYEEVIRLVCDPTVGKRPPVPSTCPPQVAGLMQNCFQGNPNDRPTAKEIDVMLQAQGSVQGRVVRIEALNKELAESNEKISSEQATQLGHFASMSHEIRTPLNCIIGISSLLEEDQTLDLAQRDSVKMIVSSGKLLRHVVDDVLDFSKFVSGNAEIDIRRVNLQDTMANIVTSMTLSPITERKNISLRTFYDPLVPQYVETDDRRLQQIFYNLLSNAVKFSCENGHVDLSVSVGSRFQNQNLIGANSNPTSSQQRPELRISIKDYGKGIPPTEFDKIFQPFAQTESGITNVDGGTGLGLAIVKQLVEALGGSISVDSRLGEWTMFSLRFPLTVSVVDKKVITARLRNCCVWLVTDMEGEAQCIAEACEQFQVLHHHCQSMHELGGRITSETSAAKSHVFLVQDSLYKESIFESLSLNLPKTSLVTFGSEGKVSQAQAHYQSLSRVFPSVLMQEIDSLSNLNRPARRVVKPRKVIEEEGTGPIGFDGLKILVAEDNLVNQKVMRRLLQRLGVTNVQVAENGKVAVEMEAAESFDVVFMDIQMPVMDGMEACKLIAARSDVPPKLIFLSAHVMADHKSLCAAHGATDYMTKPVTIDDTRKQLEQLMTMPYGGQSQSELLPVVSSLPLPPQQPMITPATLGTTVTDIEC